MFGVECFDTHDVPISHYTQWDINQTLKIVLYGMDDGYMKNAPYVHFANVKRSEALVVRSTLQGDNTVLVDIPNQLLQESYPLLIYVYLNDSSDASSQRTIVKIEIPVHKRARPSDYEYVENIDKITAEVIKQEIYDDLMDEVNGGNIAYPYVTFIDESTGKHVNLKVSDEKFGLYVDSTNRQLLDTGDIVNNLMTNSSTKALSASMGATLKNMIDVIPDQIDEKIEKHDSSPTSHSDIRDDIAEIEKRIDDITLDDTISGSGILTTTDTLVDYSPIEMRIKGNTRQNLWVNPTGTSKGITATGNANGSLTVGGTSTGGASINGNPRYILRPGTQYTLSVSPAPVPGLIFQVLEQNANGDKTYRNLLSYSTSLTFTTLSDTVLCLMRAVVSSAGTTVSGTYRVMLNEGSEAEPWCPPGLNSMDELSIVTAGKNLFDGEFPTSVPKISFGVLPPGSYTVSMLSNEAWWQTASNGNRIYFSKGPMTFMDMQNTVIGQRCYGTFTNPVMQEVALTDYTDGIWEKCSDFQLELGSTATPYEPPSVTTTPIDLDGNTLCSLPDGTHDELTIDATGAVTLTKRTWSDVFDGTENWQDGTTRYGLNTGATFATTADTVVGDKQMADTLPIVDAVSNSNGIKTYSSRWVDASVVTMLGDLARFKAWLGNNNTTLIYKLAEPQTISLTPVTLPSFPSDKSNIYTTSNVPTAGLTVRYWKKGGELVANLYKLLRNHEA